MSKGTLKPPGSGGNRKTGIAVVAVTAVFATIGAVLLVVGYHDEFLQWMVTTGIAMLVIAAVPLVVWAFMLINRKIES